MLVNLRHYLELHAGEARRVPWARHKAEMPRETIYTRLTGQHGIFGAGLSSNLQDEDSYSLRSALGEEWARHGEIRAATSRILCDG
jgi:hypothetical protein